ncbi:hypothetical protein B566_EDAN005926 [Ephemera danica]|nr:hypothetical protein B566_EDAN005926 [Ephemera danica]
MVATRTVLGLSPGDVAAISYGRDARVMANSVAAADAVMQVTPSEDVARAGGSDSGVELGAGTHGGLDGYASGLESLVGAASTSCESSLLSFSGDLDNCHDDTPPRAASGSGSSSAGRRTATPTSRRSPGATTQKQQQQNTRTAAATSRRSETKGTSSSGTTARAPRRTEARSASRGRTPPVSTDDGRWPSVSIKPARRSTGNSSVMSTSVTSSSERRAQRANVTPPESRSSSTLDKYGTLPRRTRPATVTLQAPPNVPVSRETSLSRTASLRRQRVTTTSGSSSGYRSDAEDASGSSVRSKSLTRTLPPYPRKRRSHNMRDAAAQTLRDPRSNEELIAKVERLNSDYAKCRDALTLAERSLQSERAEKESLRDDAERVAKRIASILHGDGAVAPRSDWLAELEARLSATSDVAARHQRELLKAQRHNRSLAEELERTKNAMLTAHQQLTDAEEESLELQDFLAAEKSTLAESLREAEEKVASLAKQLEQKEKDIARHQDECRHLVRLSEKRRQDAEALRAQVSSTERLLVSQGGCTTAASVALAGLCSRLESLLPQLHSPEQVEVFVNEAYSSVEASPESKRRSPPCSPRSDEESLAQVRSPAGLHDVEDEEEERCLTGSPSLNDLTQAIISCHSCQTQPDPPQDNATLTDQASELDQLVSKLMATFQNLLLQRENTVVELGKVKQKYESEHCALLEANSQLEEQSRRMRQLETAQRIAQQTDESATLRERLAERERQLVVSQSPALVQLQQELEETNFRCVTLPSPLDTAELQQNGGPTLAATATPSVADSLALLQALHMPGTVNGTA